ncbi:hypothetical protein RHMOL_Rhmol01G0009700 [Rhododendron molle]|uniref:Uncharacterized protein n=1 Tax=Rhododendron molle TaxID=49168 RepID=A0ACC0PXD3_RHOML|nr:hypothetical protein RHMOL_Rhmol01G0009700 [Rhododendron molle]
MGGETNPFANPPPMSPRKTSENDSCDIPLTPIAFFLFGVLISCLFIVIAKYDYSIAPKFQIDSISAPTFAITNGWDNRMRILHKNDLNLSFTVTNPSSHRDMICDNIFLLVSYKKELVLGGFLAPFHQEAGERKTVRETVGAASTGFVSNVVVARALVEAKALNFTVRVDGRVKYAPGTSSEKVHGLKVLCKNVPTDLYSEAGKPEECKVEVVEAL